MTSSQANVGYLCEINNAEYKVQNLDKLIWLRGSASAGIGVYSHCGICLVLLVGLLSLGMDDIVAVLSYLMNRLPLKIATTM